MLNADVWRLVGLQGAKRVCALSKDAAEWPEPSPTEIRLIERVVNNVEEASHDIQQTYRACGLGRARTCSAASRRSRLAFQTSHDLRDDWCKSTTRWLTSHDGLSKKFGHAFVVDNRPSAGGVLATTQVVNAAPDGYTLLFTASSAVFLAPLVQKMNFIPAQRLMPVTNVGTGSQDRRNQTKPAGQQSCGISGVRKARAPTS